MFSIQKTNECLNGVNEGERKLSEYILKFQITGKKQF